MDWSQLPSDLLSKIAGTLDSEIADIIRFAAVCKAWRSSLKSSSNLLPRVRLPWLLSPNNKNKVPTNAFSLSDLKIYTLDLPESRENSIFAASLGFFFTVDRQHLVSLLNPITKSQIPLPPLPLEVLGNKKLVGIERCKVVNRGETLVVMVSLCFGPILCYRQMEGDAAAAWTMLCNGDESPPPIEYASDFAYYGGRYFLLDEKESVTSIVDPDTGRVVLVIPSVGTDRPFHSSDRYSSVRRRYLVESSSGEKLFLVIAPSRTGSERFEVFELVQNEKHTEWSKVRSIGNETLFVDTDHAVALPAADFDGYRGNCIVFLNYEDEESTDSSWWVKATGLSLFDIGNDRVEELPCSDENVWEEGNVVWFVPSL